MTATLYRSDPYLREAPGIVTAITPEGGVVLSASLFYPRGGGQPGDTGRLAWPGGGLTVTDAVKGEGEAIILVPAGGEALPEIGMPVTQMLDWDRRHQHMRVHTALHLLSVVIPLPVTGGAIGEGRGRLDFDMPEAPADREALEAALNDLVTRDLAVTEDWITDDALRANPGLVKTMSVAPPMGAGRVRLIRIGAGEAQVDLQPCGGTHVRSTAEIGPLRLGKIEKKGRQNRRVTVELTG
ncbi:alanyl-tRNA editing protein [Rhodovulum euryhalinum]|uniref:Ala-tRNA(Pro) hydrolase n=1 Tax=Rhodovulum euryhalinum TaxID=35805 RepID=A0A4V2SA81_9RHOB|nr:alanyl-tRNA editing protein [Rhodovulum euryhalinum]TCO70630.1 Ala-tRNA(Pro) hydrolase [Rhodovulum euryhalinum]